MPTLQSLPCGLRPSGLLQLILLMLAVLTLFNLLPHSYPPHPQALNFAPDQNRGDNPIQNKWLVNTKNCKIPHLDPYDSTIRHLVRQVDPIRCESMPSITYTEGSLLKINRTAAKNYFPKDLNNCSYQAVYRPAGPSDDAYAYSARATRFTSDTNVVEDFIRVQCHDQHGWLFYTNFHAFVHAPEKSTWPRSRQVEGNHSVSRSPLPVSVILLGADSVSRLNFIRQMPATRDFLLSNLSAFELLGYNKVADNTFVNLTPLLTGKFVAELPWIRGTDIPFDSFDFIWKNFSASGYRTLYAEDNPAINIFNYNKKGFSKAPADYYFRPMALAMEKNRRIWNADHHCVVDRPETEMVLEYTKSFMSTLQDQPHFGFTFISRLTHDDLNRAGAADRSYLEFFSNLKKRNLLNNTVLIFFSDHGIRYGPIRKTYIGQLEERLPFIFLVLPDRFCKIYPTKCTRLSSNRHKLSTPFDVHETLKDLLNLQDNSKQMSQPQRGYSLFDLIPEERRCEDAAILEHWCTCHQKVRVNSTNYDVINVSRFVVSEVNEMLSIYNGACLTLSLDRVLSAHRVDVSSSLMFSRYKDGLKELNQSRQRNRNKLNPRHGREGQQRRVVHYLVVFQTIPGRALFEATVRVVGTVECSFSVIGDVSRISVYGNSSSCISSHRHERYCQCSK